MFTAQKNYVLYIDKQDEIYNTTDKLPSSQETLVFWSRDLPPGIHILWQQKCMPEHKHQQLRLFFQVDLMGSPCMDVCKILMYFLLQEVTVFHSEENPVRIFFDIYDS